MVIEASEVRILDSNSAFYGVPPDVLMENAGRGAVEKIMELYPNASKIVVLCGKGNNGGDGFVCSRYLQEAGRNVKTVVLASGAADIKTKLAQLNMSRLDSKSLIFFASPDSTNDLISVLNEADLIIDAMLGAGTRGQLRPPYSDVVDLLNHRYMDIPIVSIDIPTGIGTGKSIRPVTTITFHDIKTGMSQANSGNIEIIDIGIPPEAQALVGHGELLLYPGIKNMSGVGKQKKGDRGRLLIIGGGPFTGAPALAALAAERVGTDLVFVAAPYEVSGIIASYSPDIIVKPVGEDRLFTPDILPDVIDLIKETRPNAIVIGNGIGRGKEQRRFLNKFILNVKNIPLCLDADALTQIDHVAYDYMKNRGILITPHIREYNVFASGYNEDFKIKETALDRVDAELVDDKLGEGPKNIMALAKKLTISILLKGSMDVITDGTRIKVNKTGNIGMTSGGTGDVLAGICGGLMSMGLKSYDAARLGAYINCYAGDVMWDHKRFGLTATDIIDAIPRIFFEIPR